MGHTVDTYHDIQSIGIDKLRNVYASSGLAIKEKTQISKLETLKEMIRALGLNPEQLLTKDALSQGAITCNDNEELQNHQLKMLSQQLRAHPPGGVGISV